jgi:uncharacterized protein (DUF1810 family)
VPVDDPYNLARFVAAQDADGTYRAAVTELGSGRKTSHWMWFVFPQIAGLGHSQMARRFALSSLQEAQAYRRHATLGPRLIKASRIVADLEGRTAPQIFGGVDAQKLHSSMTLFWRADAAEPVFAEVLERYFAGAPDPATDQRL